MYQLLITDDQYCMDYFACPGVLLVLGPPVFWLLYYCFWNICNQPVGIFFSLLVMFHIQKLPNSIINSSELLIFQPSSFSILEPVLNLEFLFSDHSFFHCWFHPFLHPQCTWALLYWNLFHLVWFNLAIHWPLEKTWPPNLSGIG